jgi:hypothetical protein
VSWYTASPQSLAQAGWRLREVTTDNGSEFRAKEFGAAVERLGACVPADIVYGTRKTSTTR